jgi:putative transcriptional regulator
MALSLEERFERLGPTRAVDRVTSGSPAVFVLRIQFDNARLKPIDAAHALARRGMPMLRAKRAVEALLEDQRVFAELPMVEDVQAVIADLAACGVAAVLLKPDLTVDVRALRERLRLTREQFAIRYGLEVETLRNWETGKREPDSTARSYLRAISNAPEEVESAYALRPLA